MDEKTNSLTITGTPKQLSEIKGAIEIIDGSRVPGTGQKSGIPPLPVKPKNPSAPAPRGDDPRGLGDYDPRALDPSLPGGVDPFMFRPELFDKRIPDERTVIKLKEGVDCKQTAAMLELTFNMPGDGPLRVEITPVARDNTLEVRATPQDVLLMKKLLHSKLAAEPDPEKTQPPQAPMPAAGPQKMSFRMQDKSWDEVLRWFSEASGLTPIYTVKPTGKFTHIPPTPETEYTIGEIVDILNEAMIQQKFTLVRRKVSFTILPTDEKIDGMPGRAELADLPYRGKTEVVQVLIPLTRLAVEDVMPEVQKMLTPFGTVSMLSKLNTLVVVDAAGNIQRIANTIRDVEEGCGDYITHTCKYMKASELAEKLRKHLAEKDGEKPGDKPRPDTAPRDERNLLGKLAGRVKSFAVTVDERKNSLIITAPPHKLVEAKKFIEENDKPQYPGQPEWKSSEPQLRRYPVAVGSAEAYAKTLREEMPSIKVLALPESNEIIVLATLEEHFRIIPHRPTAVDAKKPEAPMPAAPKKLSLQMTDQPWEKVLEWYASATGLKPMYTVKLSGTFNHTPSSADMRYTLGEITDILNDALAGQKLLLIRRQVTFTIVSTQDQPQQNWSLIPRVEMSELPDRGRTEVVQVLIGLRNVSVEDILPEAKKVVSPLGAATMWKNTVIVVDRVDNIRRIAQLIADAEASEARK